MTSSENTPQRPRSGVFSCDRKGCMKTPAVMFCANCEHRLCQTHFQGHDLYFGEEHEVLDMQTYEQQPDKYTKTYCGTHSNQVLVKGCINCFKLFCSICEHSGEICSETGQGHSMNFLVTMVEEMASHYRLLMKDVQQKLSHLAKAKAKGKRHLEEIEVNCNKWKQEVKVIRDVQIDHVVKEAERAIAKIDAFKDQAVHEVEMFESVLAVDEEELESLHVNIRRLAKIRPVTEKLRRKLELTNEVKEKLEQLDFSNATSATNADLMVAAGPNSSKMVDFIRYPFSITCIGNVYTNSYCYAACYKHDGELLIGCENGLWMLRTDNMLLKLDLPFYKVTSIIERNSFIYLLHRTKNNCLVEMCQPDLRKSQTLLTFQKARKYAASLAVSEKHVIVYVPSMTGTRHLLIYHRYNGITVSIDLTAPGIPYLLPSGELLSVGLGTLTKYQIEEESLVDVWTCAGLPDLCSVCVGPDSIIYGSTLCGRKVIYVICPSSGKKWKSLYNSELTETMGSISVAGNQLAVPCWAGNKVQLYRLNV